MNKIHDLAWYAFHIITRHQPIDKPYVNRLLHILAAWITAHLHVLTAKKGQRFVVLHGDLPPHESVDA